jgi:sec-independent protein translocase protein TatA
MGALKPWHIIVLVVVLLLLFGAKRLPDAARGLGRSLRIFKSEVKEMQNDDEDPTIKPAPIAGTSLDKNYNGSANGTVNGSHDADSPAATRDR